jgi:hypothetical protein
MRDYARNIAYCLAFRQAERKANHMGKQLSKPIFGVPSLEVASRIDASDICASLTAAHYRLATRMGELEYQFEAKASELRQAYLNECDSAIQGG